MYYVNSMYTLMYLKATCVTECFITYYSDMDAPTSCTNWCTCRCSSFLNLFYRHTTRIWTLPSIYTMSDYLLYWMFNFTRHSDMDASHHVHIDVTSDYLLHWMFYYTHHIDMDAPQYVHVDAPWEHLFHWMSHYTHHSDMDAPHYVHVDAHSD